MADLAPMLRQVWPPRRIRSPDRVGDKVISEIVRIQTQPNSVVRLLKTDKNDFVFRISKSEN